MPDTELAPPRGGVLSIPAFRRLWIGLGLSSLGDWLGLLAITAMASALAPDDYDKQNYAIGAVLLLRVLPALLLGPLAGYVADRLDRRWTLIVGDVVRGLVFASIPIVNSFVWLLIATVIIDSFATLAPLPTGSGTACPGTGGAASTPRPCAPWSQRSRSCPATCRSGRSRSPER